MNTCEHRLSEYALRARAFTMLEHGAYSMLRDRYFDTEAPIPEAEVYRQACARSDEERQAVDSILAEFYALSDGVWRCAEFDAQLAKPQGRAKAHKRSASGELVSAADMEADGVDPRHAIDWLAVRKAKKLPLTPTAWMDTKAQAHKAGISISEAIRIAAAAGWGGFKASWLVRDLPPWQSAKEERQIATVRAWVGTAMRDGV